eukprot:3980301-Lingulodinium_polyedra.AAC.1
MATHTIEGDDAAARAQEALVTVGWPAPCAQQAVEQLRSAPPAMAGMPGQQAALCRHLLNDAF